MGIFFPLVKTISPLYARRVALDNAALLARRVYGSGLDSFDRLWARNKYNLRTTIQQIIAQARKHPKAPFEAIRAAADGRELH